MNHNKSKNKEPEVYSTTGFKDVLASPLFYPIVTITFVLGISSIFGFLQNPLKLKAVVSTINQKLTHNSATKNSITRNIYSLSKTFSGKKYPMSNANERSDNRKLLVNFNNSPVLLASNNPVGNDINQIAYNYDVTSMQLWNDLDISIIEEGHGEKLETNRVGIPLELDFQQELLPLNESIYALNSL